MNHEMTEKLSLLVRFSHLVPGYASFDQCKHKRAVPESFVHLIFHFSQAN